MVNAIISLSRLFTYTTVFRDSVTWLSKNYDTDNGIPIFFIKGNYLPSQQLLAEAEYKVTVDILKESEDSASREWAKKIHLSDYLVSGFAIIQKHVLDTSCINYILLLYSP